MKSFWLKYLKKHLLLLLAAVLPLIISITVIGFNAISRHFVEMPRHGFLFSLMPKYDQPIRYTIINGTLHMVLDSQFELKKLDTGLFPKLYFFDMKTQKSELLPVDIEGLIEKTRRTKKFEQAIDLKAFKQKKLNADRKASDGYRVITFDNPYMFGSKAIIFNIAKKGYIIKIAYPEGKVDLGHRAAFIGWVEG
ncbi:MAG: hypothetical protein RLZ35_564 [Pseudomonadota bacterium]|jgi:hypothetical protein